jgi:hypothetical protein
MFSIANICHARGKSIDTCNMECVDKAILDSKKDGGEKGIK